MRVTGPIDCLTSRFRKYIIMSKSEDDMHTFLLDQKLISCWLKTVIRKLTCPPTETATKKPCQPQSLPMSVSHILYTTRQNTGHICPKQSKLPLCDRTNWLCVCVIKVNHIYIRLLHYNNIIRKRYTK